MTTVEPATPDDIDRLVQLESRLFHEDACAEAHVESYVANQGAQRFYERLGFQARSVSRTLRR